MKTMRVWGRGMAAALTLALGACSSASDEGATGDATEELASELTSDEWTVAESNARTFDIQDTTFDAVGEDTVLPDSVQRAGGRTYRNPILGRTPCPDPSVMKHGGAYYMVCTSRGNPSAFPIRKSYDLLTWHDLGDVFPRDANTHPAWATRGTFWAPEMYVIENRFVVYFAAKGLDGKMAIGAATASNARGPYRDLGHPLVALPAAIPSGLIDPTVVRDPRDGALYLYFCVQPKQIYVHRLAPSGLAVVGPSKHLFTADLPWEKDKHGHAVAEGPEAMYRDGWFYLFFSGASTFDGSYAVGVVRSREPTGPFEPYAGNPILRSGSTWLAPGHNSHLVQGPDGADYMFYHAIRSGTEVRRKGDPLPRRLLFVDRVTWDQDGWPHLRNREATDRAEPAP